MIKDNDAVVSRIKIFTKMFDEEYNKIKQTDDFLKRNLLIYPFTPCGGKIDIVDSITKASMSKDTLDISGFYKHNTKTISTSDNCDGYATVEGNFISEIKITVPSFIFEVSTEEEMQYKTIELVKDLVIKFLDIEIKRDNNIIIRYKDNINICENIKKMLCETSNCIEIKTED